MAMADIGKRLNELRTGAGLSQKELGDQLGISNRAVSKWEKGLSLPSIDNLMKLAEIFHITMEDLLTRPSAVAAEKERPKGMESLRELYRIGRGPSSSHTMGPEKACKLFKEHYPWADHFKAVLYGSLAKTGKGHGTDSVIRKTFQPLDCKVEFDLLTGDMPHPNTMELIAYRGEQVLGTERFYSVGGGRILSEEQLAQQPPVLYTLKTFREIAEYCEYKQLRLWEYVEEVEGREIWDFLGRIWDAMKVAVVNGLQDEGVLPGGLEVQKKAKYLYNLQHIDESPATRENREVSSYAFAVSEQNACGGMIVTAPTCGACGVVPAVLYYQQKKQGFSDRQIVQALAVGGLIGNLVKTNASISGAECGCQAEIGTACAMAAAALGELFQLSLEKIEYAAEVAIEHHLGLTCDPINGLVQIPCIERNAVAAMRAINAVSLSSFLSGSRKISLDKVIVAMKETGRDLARQYRETSEGGLAKIELK